MDRSKKERRPAGGPRWHRIGLRWAPVVAIVLAGGLMIWYRPMAWVAAVLAGIVFIMEVRLAAIDRRVRQEPALPPMPEPSREEAVLAGEERVGAKTGLAIAGGLAAIAVVIAAAFLDWTLVGMGALAIFAWTVMVGLPVWVAAIEEEIETEHDRLTGRPRPTR